jgi:hypothetical protein
MSADLAFLSEGREYMSFCLYILHFPDLYMTDLRNLESRGCSDV